MTGLELKQLIKELEEKHSNFDEMQVVLADDAEYVSMINTLDVEELKRETKEVNPRMEGNYRFPRDGESPDEKFIVFSYYY